MLTVFNSPEVWYTGEATMAVLPRISLAILTVFNVNLCRAEDALPALLCSRKIGQTRSKEFQRGRFSNTETRCVIVASYDSSANKTAQRSETEAAMVLFMYSLPI